MMPRTTRLSLSERMLLAAMRTVLAIRIVVVAEDYFDGLPSEAPPGVAE